MITNNNKSEKTAKKGMFSQSELKEIEVAMKRDGFKSWSEYSLFLIRTRNDISAIADRRREMLRYKHSNLFTYYNQIISGVNPMENLKLFIEEAGNICAELM